MYLVLEGEGLSIHARFSAEQRSCQECAGSQQQADDNAFKEGIAGLRRRSPAGIFFAGLLNCSRMCGQYKKALVGNIEFLVGEAGRGFSIASI